MNARVDPLETAIRRGACAALRRHAEYLRKKAAPLIGMTGDERRPVIVVPSEAREILNFADDWSQIADELEGTP